MATTAIALIFMISLASATEYHHYVVSSDGAPCPVGGDCHNISYYLSHYDVYLTSNTVLTFLNGTHHIEQDEVITVREVNNLTFQGLGAMEPGFHWSIKQSAVKVICTHSVGGLLFYNCTDIAIERLTFSNCGSQFQTNESQYRQYLTSLENGLYSSLYNFSVYESAWISISFIFSNNINLQEMSIQNCSGYCLLGFNTQNIVIKETYIAHSEPTVYRQECCVERQLYTGEPKCIGGNVLLLYLDHPNCTNNDEVSVYDLAVTNSAFSFGAGHSLRRVAMSSVIILGVTGDTLNASFDSVLLYGNNGGGLGAFTVNATIKLVNVTSTRANEHVCRNIETVIGGMQLAISNGLYCPPHHDYFATNLLIDNCTFSYNKAQDPAGINLPTSFVVTRTDVGVELSYHISNTVFHNNEALFGSALAAGGTSLTSRLFSASTYLYMSGRLKNVAMFGNLPRSVAQLDSTSSYRVVPPCGLLVVNAGVLTANNVTISDHQMLGAFIYNTQVFFKGDVTFINNTGILGGGISLVGNSIFTLLPSVNVSFIDNRAQRGAAIFVSQALVTSLLYPQCPIQVVDILNNDSNSTLYFTGNQADVTGNVLYGGLIESCLINQNATSVRISDYFDDIFDYVYSSTDRDVSSDILSVCFCMDDEPSCNMINMTTQSYVPGQTLNLSLVAAGERNGTTTGRIKITRMDKFSTLHDLTTPSCRNVSLVLKYSANSSETSYDGANSTYVIEADVSYNHVEAKPLYLVVPLDPCPVGFSLNTSSSCGCSPHLTSAFHNVDCNVNTQLVTIDHGWIGFDSSRDCILMAESCPLNYCISGEVTVNLSDPSSPCVKNRSGVLCGQCIDGYSVVLGSNVCRDCTNNNGLFLLVLFAAAGVGLIVLLLLLNMTVSVGTINGLIFYANIIKLNEDAFFPKGPVPLLSQVTAWLNLDFGIETCFYDGLTPYVKVWLQFVFPVYMWVIILAVIVVSRRSSRLARMVGTNGVPVLATLLLLSYVKIIFTFIMAMKLSHVECNGVSSSVWKVDGNLAYWDTRHTILFAFAILMMVVTVVPYTFIVLFSPIFERQSQRCGTFWLNFLKPVADAYCGPFNDRFRFWTGLGLLARLLIAFPVPFLPLRESMFVVMFVTLFLLVISASVCGVYKKWYLNVLENWFFANILGASTLALGNQGYEGTIVSASLVYFTFFCIIIGHCIWRCSCCPCKSGSYKVSQAISHSRVMTTDVAVNRLSQPFIEPPSLPPYEPENEDRRHMKFRESLLDYEDPTQ